VIRIFVEQLEPGQLAIGGDEHHYLGRVRRVRVGDAIELRDAQGRRAAATIAAMTAAETLVTVGEVLHVASPVPAIDALVPLIKGDRMDTCLEKLVEVGADEIVLWPAARAVVRLDAERREARLAKYRAALQAGARQCGRAAVPAIRAADSLATALASLPPATPTAARLVLDPAADRGTLPTADDVTILSGPEGGIAPDELDALAAAGFAAVGLGPSVLRADTAPVVAVAIVRHAR